MTTPDFAQTNETHDPNIRSWVEAANDPASDFPITNLPYCAFEAEHDGHSHRHLGMVIGDRVLDISMIADAGVLDIDNEELIDDLHAPFWTFVAAQKPEAWRQIRRSVHRFLRADTHAGQQARRLREKAIRPLATTPLILPIPVVSYTDFYASIHHASTVGAMFRPDNPLLPNYKHVPIGYHGRTSSIIASPAAFRRPRGQTSPPDANPEKGPGFGPCAMLDYELEVACYIGGGNELGASVPLAQAHDHVFGLGILNDWSARDMQKWEYQPLGPFLAKNFATSVSPMIVSREALAPFRTAAATRPAGDPRPLPYLTDETDQAFGGYDIQLEVLLETARMREANLAPVRLSHGRAFKDLYWTFGQMIAHHASNGCNLGAGDLIASGTVSGPEPDSRGCLLELTWAGTGKPRTPISLPTGETRTFLADGDTVIMRAFAEREGFRRIGFGECRGTVLPAGE